MNRPRFLSINKQSTSKLNYYSCSCSCCCCCCSHHLDPIPSTETQVTGAVVHQRVLKSSRRAYLGSAGHLVQQGGSEVTPKGSEKGQGIVEKNGRNIQVLLTGNCAKIFHFLFFAAPKIMGLDIFSSAQEEKNSSAKINSVLVLRYISIK